MPRPGLTERNAAEIISSSITDGEKEQRVPKVVVRLGIATLLLLNGIAVYMQF